MRLRCIILILVTLGPLFGFAQGDMLILKKKDRVFKTYFVGSFILFDQGLGWQEAQITGLRNDSLFLTYYQKAVVSTAFGTPMVGTVGETHEVIDYNWIQKVGEPKKGWTPGYVGEVLLTGGMALTIPALIARAVAKKNSPYYPSNKLLIISSGAAVAGFLLVQGKEYKTWEIGKKYSFQYISTK